MYIARENLQKLLERRGLKLKDLLKRAGVSKTAFYSLLRQDDILPRSLQAIAHVLQVRPSAFLQELHSEEKKSDRLTKKWRAVLARHPKADPDNVWHALLMLEDKPFERLKRSILRAQKFDFH